MNHPARKEATVNLFRKLANKIVGVDPNPAYSRLDRMDGLCMPLSADAAVAHLTGAERGAWS